VAPDLYNGIAHCRLFSCAGIWLSVARGGAPLQLGTLAARNEVLRQRPRQLRDAPDARPQGAIVVEGPARLAAVEGNRIAACDVAVEVAAGPVGTLVRRNRMTDIQNTPVLDQGAESIVAAFTDKAGFHDHWPQGFNVLQLFRGATPKPEEKK
jgi:hypothetical protein